MANRDRSDLISRRDALSCGAAAASGLLWGTALTAGLRAGTNVPADGTRSVPATGTPAGTRPAAKAKAVIQFWLGGGPSHLDMFDPKPEAGNDYCGPLDHPLATNVDGIRISELLPELAKQADKYSLIRSMTHGNSGHETAAYLVQTGRKQGGRLVYPSVGAVVSLLKGYEGGYNGLIPPYVVLTQPQGRFSEAGYLGSRYKPYATGGNPGAAEFVVEGIVAAGISFDRQKARRDLLGELNSLEQALPNDEQLVASRECEQRAYDLILGDEGKVFDLAQEKDDVRLQYGRTTIGQSCLMARRLVEHGFRYITINNGGWDTHKQNFTALRRKLPELDKGLSTLLAELSERGLLESTLIWCCGEFGRTPKIAWDPPWDGGRHHFGSVFSVLVAGGGFKGGHVVGASDEKGEKVKDRPVYPVDLLGSIYELLGIDPDGELPRAPGRDEVVRLTPTPEESTPRGGRLKEIM